MAFEDIDYIDCLDNFNQTFCVVKQVDSRDGIRIVRYRLDTGEKVEKINDSLFRIVDRDVLVTKKGEAGWNLGDW